MISAHLFRSLVVLTGCMALAVRAGQPTADEQYWLELVNRARTNPAAELERLVNYQSPTSFASPSSDNPHVASSLAYFGTNAAVLAAQWSGLSPVSALAWNSNLGSSAMTYTQTMLSADAQSHTLDAYSIDGRLTAAGYPNYLEAGENLFVRAESVDHGHAGFLIDWGDDDSNPLNGYGTGIQVSGGPSSPTHRQVTMDPSFRELGIGISSAIPPSNLVAFGPQVVTQHFGTRYRASAGNFYVDAIATGSVYQDSVLANNFYTPGEGISGQMIEVYLGAAVLPTFTGQTNTAGGYNIELPGLVPGQTIRIAAPGLGVTDQWMTISGYTDSSTYGLPVQINQNIYSSFQAVPEPNQIIYFSLAFLLLIQKRNLVTRPERERK